MVDKRTQNKRDNIKIYLNNPNLKAAGVSMKYTKAQVEEYVLCSKDPLYFIERYIKIVDVDKGLVPFKVRDYQKEIINTIANNRFTIAKCSRQIGKSTSTVSYILWEILFHPLTNVAILANKATTARDILGRLRMAYEHIPGWMQQGIIEWNKGSIELENGSKVIAASTSSSAVRGMTLNIILLDEFAFVPRNIAEEFFTSVYPTVTSGESTKVIIISTPNGMNLFWKFWVDATEGNNKYIPIEAHWWQVPGHDEQWKRDTIANMGQERFDQEFGNEFIGSTNTLIKPSKIKELAFVKPIVSKNGFDIYEHPIKNTVDSKGIVTKQGHTYVIAADIGEGLGLDYSVFSVIDVTEFPYKLVAKYRTNDVSPLLVPNAIYAAGQAYNDALVLIEVNNIGAQVADILHGDLQYENVLMTQTNGKFGQQATQILKTTGTKLGVKMSKQVKSIGCSNLKTLIEEDKLLITDYDTITEISSFIQRGPTYMADIDCHDDTVMSLVVFAWLTGQKYFKDYTDSDVRRKMFEERMAAEEDCMPFGYRSDGLEVEEGFEDDEGDYWVTGSQDERPARDQDWVTDIMRRHNNFWSGKDD